MIKKLSMFAIVTLMVVSVLALAAHAAPVPVTIEKVWFNGRSVALDGSEVRGDIMRGDELEVEVKLVALEDSDNVRVSVDIEGDDRSDIDERTEAFSISAGEVYFKRVRLEIPDNLDLNDPDSRYVVHIEVSNRQDDRVTQEFVIDVETPRHSLEIEDVIFNPGLTVEAGRSLLASVRVENNGEKDEEDVKVTLTLEGVGSDADYIDELEADDETMSEQLYVPIPVCTAAGTLTARVRVDYDENTRDTELTFPVTVLGSVRCSRPAEQRTVITVGPESQNIIAGGNEAVYPIAITNAGSDSRTYTVQLTAGTWAESRLSSNVLVVDAGETQVAYAYARAKSDASAGEKMFSIAVHSGGEQLENVMLRANVVNAGTPTGATTANLRQGLQIGLIVLVVLLVVVGLIVGFSRLKDGNGKDDETYY
jgi:uncharacterized membrane protein